MTGDAITHGNCIEAMRAMSARSVDIILTDPPYHLVGTPATGA
jgi:DNA modification methylase